MAEPFTLRSPPQPPAPSRAAATAAPKSRRLVKAYLIWGAALTATVSILLILASGPAVMAALKATARSMLTWEMLTVAAAALACEYVDSTLGMGYGTTLTPVLMLVGFDPLAVVPAILVSELVTGITGGIMHHGAGNVNFRRGSRDRHVALVLAGCSLAGTVGAVLLSVNLPTWALKAYIGALVLAIGVTILATMNRAFRFSWKRIGGLGLLAAFNKGMSGGGYGPVVAGGQILAGMDATQAIGITSMAEGLTCTVGAAMYLATTGIDWRLALPMATGAMLSVPLSAHSVRLVGPRRLRWGIGILTMALGAATLVRLVW